MRIFFTIILWTALLSAALAEPANPWAASPGKKEFPNATAIILMDDIQATVNADGTHELVEYDAIKLLDKDAVERFGRTTRLYDSKVETVEVPLARVWSPDGHMTVVPPRLITDTVPEGLKKDALYQRMRQITVEFKEAAEGSVVEFRIVHHRKVPWPAKKFWEISYTQDFEPILDTQFSFTSPDRMGVEIATPGTSGLQPEVSRGNGRTTMKWHLKDRAALVRQPAMPPLRQLATQIQVSNFSDWNDFGNWARAMWDQAAAPQSAIGMKASNLVARQLDENGKIRAIMAWIDKDKPSPSVDISLEELAPMNAAQALTASSLTAQDRAVLLLAMLRSATVKAYPALVSTADYGDPTRGVPSLQQFNRVLVVVPAPGGGWIWLDPSSSAPGMLGPGLSERPALILNGLNKLVSTPVATPEANREEISGDARLDVDGSMETRLELAEYGARAMIWRARAEANPIKDLQQFFQTFYVATIPSTAVVQSLYIPKGTDGPLRMSLGYEQSRAGTRAPSGDGYQTAVPLWTYVDILSPQTSLTRYAELSTAQRKYPVYLPSSSYEERRLRIVVPSGWSIKSMPHSVKQSNSVGSYQVDVRSEDRTIHFYSRLILRRTEIPLADYAQFKELMNQVAATATELIVLELPAQKR